MFPFSCLHEWKLVEDTYNKSPFERLAAAGLTKIENLPKEAVFGTRIIILKCTTCGKLDKTIEKV